MINKHTDHYHPSPSELTSRIDPLIFLWTPKGFISPESFLKVHICRFENLPRCSCSYKNTTLKILHF